MINRKELDQIASIPVFGPLWAEAVENWMCVTDALHLVDMREALYADTNALVRDHDAFAPVHAQPVELEAPRRAA